jgi:hypothetical protein
MNIKVSIGKRQFQLQFRLAVICQLMEFTQDGLEEREVEFAVCNPKDKFVPIVGIVIALRRMLDTIQERWHQWGVVDRDSITLEVLDKAMLKEETF